MQNEKPEASASRSPRTSRAYIMHYATGSLAGMLARVCVLLVIAMSFLCSCSKKPAASSRPKTVTIPSEEPYFYVADGALDLYYSPATEPLRPGVSVATYELDDEFPPTELLKKIRDHLQAQQWHEINLEPPQFETPTGRWVPLPRGGVKSEDQWYTMLYVREQGDSLRVSVFYWKMRPSGPRFKVQMSHTDVKHATSLVDYCRAQGLLPQASQEE